MAVEAAADADADDVEAVTAIGATPPAAPAAVAAAADDCSAAAVSGSRVRTHSSVLLFHIRTVPSALALEIGRANV